MDSEYSAYMSIVKRMEEDLPVPVRNETSMASIAISMKRIADSLELLYEMLATAEARRG